jgi:hypothetical protein
MITFTVCQDHSYYNLLGTEYVKNEIILDLNPTNVAPQTGTFVANTNLYYGPSPTHTLTVQMAETATPTSI